MGNHGSCVCHLELDICSDEYNYMYHDSLHARPIKEIVVYELKICNFGSCLWWSCSGLKVSVITPGASGPDLSPDQGHCIAFLDKTHYSHSALPTQVCKWVLENVMPERGGGDPAME